MTELSPGARGLSICRPPEGSSGRFGSLQGECGLSGAAVGGKARSAEAGLLFARSIAGSVNERFGNRLD
jgi:hypothetical protein